MIPSINMSMHYEQSELFANNNPQLHGHNHFLMDDDPFAPTPIGRGPGSASSSSLGTMVPLAPPSNNNAATNNANNNMNYSGVDDPAKSFPIVLHSILSEAGVDGDIHWLPCGTRFVIANKEKFSKVVLPRYFGTRGGGGGAGSTTKFTSFTRRLKRWNFSRVPSGREMGAYYHESFRRGEPEMARRIVYPVSKGQASAAAAGSGGGGGGVAGGGKAGGKGDKGKQHAAATKIPKARRRASTGSIAPAKLDDGAAAACELGIDMTPMPIRSSLMVKDGSVLPLSLMEDDVKNFLTGDDFAALADGLGNDMAGSAETNGGAPSIDVEPVSFVSNNNPPNTFRLHPGFPPSSAVPAGQSQQSQLQGLGMPSLRTVMRRHSVTMGNLNPASISMPPMMNGSGSNALSANISSFIHRPMVMGRPMVIGSSSNAVTATNTNSFNTTPAAPPLLGMNNPMLPMMISSSNNAGTTNIHSHSFTAQPDSMFASNFSCAPKAMANANGANNATTGMNFVQNNNIMPQIMTVETKNTEPMQGAQSFPLQPDHMGSCGEPSDVDGRKSPFSFSRECSFDDLKIIDPFT